MKIIILFTALLFFHLNAFSQEKMEEGVATFEFNYPDAESVSPQTLANLGKGLTVYFKKGKSREEYDNAGRWVNIVDPSKKEILSMGTPEQDVATKMTWKEKEDNQALAFRNYSVKVTGELKDIAGLKCKKAIVSYNDGQTMEVWFTSQLYASNTQYFFNGIDGFIMQYSHVINLYPDIKFTVEMVCKKVEKTKVSDSMFKLPSNCKLVTAE